MCALLRIIHCINQPVANQLLKTCCGAASFAIIHLIEKISGEEYFLFSM